MSQEVLIEKVKSKVEIVKDIDDEALLDFVVSEVVDRVSIYLNIDDDFFDRRLVNIIVRISCGVFTQTIESKVDGGQEMAITSISDNGQSISYSSDKTKSYLATSEDSELFSGFEKLLKPYRRVNVIT